MKLGGKLTSAFVLGLLIIGAVGLQAFRSIQQLRETNRWVIHTHEVLSKLEQVLSLLKDAETGQRGFLLTGEEHYLEPYTAAVGQITATLDEVAFLTRDNPAQQIRLPQLRQLMRNKLDEMQGTIALRRTGGLAAALPVVRTDHGEQIMDEIRALIQEMNADEQQLLDARNRAAAAATKRTVGLISGGMLLALVVLGVAAIIAIRALRLADQRPPTGPGGRSWFRLGLQYSFAVGMVAAGTGLRLWLERAFGPMPLFVTFYPAVLLVAVIGGGGPGLLVTVLTAMVTTYWFIPPVGSFVIAHTNDAVALGIFCGTGLLISLLVERLHRALRTEVVSGMQEQELALLNLGNLMALDMEHRIVRWSEGNRRLYGFTAAEVEGRRTTEVLGTQFARPVEEIHRELLTHDLWEGEVTRRSQAGVELTVALQWALRRDEHGQPVAIFEGSTDITARKQAEAKIRQLNAELEVRVRQRTAELEFANRELESFCYSVAHDLRTPLRSIAGFSQAVLEDYGPQLATEGQDFLQRVRAGCQQMEQLIDDLLKLSRVTRAPMHHEPVNLTELAQRFAGELQRLAPERVVQFQIAPDLTTTGDPSLLEAALRNLLDNAWKFTGSRAEAVIEVGMVMSDQAPDPSGQQRDLRPQTIDQSLRSPLFSLQSAPVLPVFFVRDNGVGFDMRYVDKLFGVFQRLHRQEEFAGTGVGLATVQRIFHRHGGRIWVEAAVDKGATFYFTLNQKGSAS